jgi:hypothetical protein
MPTYGHLKRDFPRLRVPRGFNPNEPFTQTSAYRVKDGEPTILSGMVISPVWNPTDSVYEWVMGVDAATTPVYFALQDATDEDVLEAGNLVGLSCAGQFELQTAFFDPAGTYVEGTLLTYAADSDGLTLPAAVAAALNGRSASSANGAGLLKTTTAGPTVTIVGQVVHSVSTTGTAGVVQSVNGTNSNVVFKDVISFRTFYQVARTS